MQISLKGSQAPQYPQRFHWAAHRAVRKHRVVNGKVGTPKGFRARKFNKRWQYSASFVPGWLGQGVGVTSARFTLVAVTSPRPTCRFFLEGFEETAASVSIVASQAARLMIARPVGFVLLGLRQVWPRTSGLSVRPSRARRHCQVVGAVFSARGSIFCFFPVMLHPDAREAHLFEDDALRLQHGVGQLSVCFFFWGFPRPFEETGAQRFHSNTPPPDVAASLPLTSSVVSLCPPVVARNVDNISSRSTRFWHTVWF